jgi:hypothetical protein
VLVKQITNILGILEDYEKNMIKMAEHIIYLEKELSELKGLS